MPPFIVTAGVVVLYAFSIASHRPFDPTDLAAVSLKSASRAFFAGSIPFARNGLTGSNDLVTKIHVSREFLPLSAILASPFGLMVGSGVIILILVWARVEVSFQLLWLPTILVLLVVLAVIPRMSLACANLFLRYVNYLVEICLTFGILLSPRLLRSKMFGKWAPISLLNPAGAVLEAINAVAVLHKPPDSFWLACAPCFSLAGSVISRKIFDRTEASLAESI